MAACLLAACSPEDGGTEAPGEQQGNAEAVETKGRQGETSNLEAVTKLEPVKKDLRVIVEDEIALIEPEQQVIERLQPEVSASDKNAAEQARLPEKPESFARPLILAANEIRSGEITIRLTGIDAPSRDKTCPDPNSPNKTWLCGNFAKAALQRLVRARTLNCEGNYLGDNLFEGRCKVGKTDLSQWLVAQGWAQSSSEEFSKLMQEAREAGKGLWRR